MSLPKPRCQRCPWSRLWDARRRPGPVRELPPPQEKKLRYFDTTFHSLFFSLNFNHDSNAILRLGTRSVQPRYPELLARTLESRLLRVPAVLNGLPTESLIKTGQSHEAVNDGAERGDFPELHAEDGSHQIEMSDSHQTPVKSADHHEDGGENV